MVAQDEKQKHKKSLATYARVLYLVIPAVTLAMLVAISSTVFNSIANDAAQRLARQYSIEAAANFQRSVHPHFLLMQQVARSTTIARWLDNEDDPQLKAMAFEEIMGYAVFSPETRLMFTSYDTLQAYDFDVELTQETFVSWGRLAGGEVSQWFFDTRDAEMPFILHIQRERPELVGDRVVMFMWSNHRMYYHGNFVGVVTVGFPFDTASEYIFGDFDVNYRRGYIIDRDGAVRVDSANLLVLDRDGVPVFPPMPEAVDNIVLYEQVNCHLQGLTDGIFLQGQVPCYALRLSVGAYRYASISPIVGTDWSVVVLSNHYGDFYMGYYMPLVVGAIVVLILAVMVGNLLVRRVVLSPLFKLTKSAADSSNLIHDSMIYGVARDDEIGYLARTIHQSHNAFKYQKRLLNMVNQAASVLLAVKDNESVDDALVQSMEMIGLCLEADRVYLLRTIVDAEGVDISLANKWLSERGQRIEQINLNQKIPFGSFPQLEGLLLSGQPLNCPLSELTETEQNFLNPYGKLTSVVIFPLIIDEQLWGLFSIDYCEKERALSDEEIGILRSASLMIASVYNRIEQATTIMRHEQDISERVRLMFDSAPIMIDYCDENFNIIDCNQTAVDFYGYTDKEDYLADTNGTLLEFQLDGTPSEMSRIEHMSIAFEKGYHTFEFMEQKLSGEVVYLEVVCIREEHNELPVLIAYFKDITQIKENEIARERMHEALMHRETLLRVVNQAATALLAVENIGSFEEALLQIMDDIGRCLNVDRMHLLHTHSDDEGVMMNVIGKWLSETGAKYPQTDFNRKFPHGVFHKFETLVAEKGYFSGLVSELPSEEQAFGNPHGVTKSTVIIPLLFDEKLWGVCTIDDCTNERDFSHDEINILRSSALITASTYRRIEQALEIKAAEEKERKALAEMHRIELAEESSMAKSRFLARMSHEIRTPISTVMGVSEIRLRDTNLSPQIEEAFAKIHNSASLLLCIVNDILDHTKIEAGKMAIMQEEYNVASVISDVAQLHLVHLDNNDIAFRMAVDENLPVSLIGDALRIEQVINNLLSNAFKYTETGSVELSLRCSNDEEDDSIVMFVVSIRDTGLGMTPEQLNDLFAEYTRFHELETRAIVGTGLGMSIVHSLVQLMNAKLDIESEVGKGTNVIVSIPQKKVGNQVLGREAALRLQQFDAYTHTAAKRFNFVPEPMPYGRVLVVDDIDANLYVAKGLLAFYDLSIETCNNGYDAIEKIQQGNGYDVIFMDQLMPGIDGTETMMRLREIGYTRPIVTLTANALIGQAELFMQKGFDGFISKPIQTSHLNSILKKFIRDRHPVEVHEAAKNSKAESASPTNKESINYYLSCDELKEKLRSDFAKNQKNSFGDICKALNAGDTKTAHRLAHSLKGLAGLIEENSLMQATEIVEHSLQNGEMPTEYQLSAIEIELTRVLRDIVKPQTVLIPTNIDFDKDSAFALFDKLQKLLASQNADSLDFLDELRTLPQSAVLCRQIENFDFKAALETLAVLRIVIEEE